MTDNKIEEYLAEAVRKNTPDILDDLLADIERAEAPITSAGAANENVWEEVRAGKATEGAYSTVGDMPMGGTSSIGSASSNSGDMSRGSTSSNGRFGRRSLKAVMSIAAVFVLMIGGFTVFSRMQQSFAVVGLDVNPSVELKINRNEVVTEAIAVNDEGEDIISDMDLRDTDLNVACNAIVGAMLKKGYLTDTSNSILVSVRAEDAARGREIEEKLAGDLNSYLGDSSIAASILGQYVEDDAELEAFAEANGISEGKAWLIRNLLATGSTRMTEESLLKLTTQELILLAQERKAGADNTVYGTADTSKYVGKDKAAAAALAAAGVEKSRASGMKVEYDSENGMIVYEVEFMAGGMEYEYDIDASTGKVIKYEKEKADNDSDDQDVDDRDDKDDRDDDLDDNDRDDNDDDHDDQDDHDDDNDHDDRDDD